MDDIVIVDIGSPSSSTVVVHKYQVFLSFRGKDTRKNFTDHLYAALLQAKIHTFKDEHALERGKNIRNELQKAIKECEIALVVFSRNYAESKWCLDELVGMMERNQTTGLIVLPVFYDVQPSHVRSQTGSFGEAFSKHEECESKEKIDGWRAALREAADLGGMVLQNEADGICRYESQFIQEIVQHIKKNLDQTPTHFQISSPEPDSNPAEWPIMMKCLSTLLLFFYIFIIIFILSQEDTTPKPTFFLGDGALLPDDVKAYLSEKHPGAEFSSNNISQYISSGLLPDPNAEDPLRTYSLSPFRMKFP